jgi:hypothetical protein
MINNKIRRRSFCIDDLLAIENDFRLIIVTSNSLGKGGKLVLQDNILCPARSTREGCTLVAITTHPTITEEPTARSQHVEQNTPASAHPMSMSNASTNNACPETLLLESLRCTCDGAILWDMIPEVALLEFLFLLVTKDDYAWDAVENEMKLKGVDMPNNFDPVELCAMSKKIYIQRK